MAAATSSAPDGSELYIGNEVDHTLDIVSTKTLRVEAKVPLTGRPNNVAVTKDGAKVYVAITGADAFVDIIDTRARANVGRIPTLGGVHNVYVTPDGRYMAAGMIGAGTLTVVDTETDEPVWSLHFDGGLRPMTFESNPDGSTKRIFVQISDCHGFYVVDFATRTVVAKILQPELPITRVSNDAGGPHAVRALPRRERARLRVGAARGSHVLEPRRVASELPDPRALRGAGTPVAQPLPDAPARARGGGDPYHGGGRRWLTQDDPEWQMLAAWVRGENPSCLSY